MFRIVWTYTVAEACTRAFERAYGPEGDWAGLFARSADFLGTALFRDVTREERYLTVDYWATEDGWREFLRSHPAEYEALDVQLAPLTITQNRVAAVSG